MTFLNYFAAGLAHTRRIVHPECTEISVLPIVDGRSEDAIGRALDILSRDCGLDSRPCRNVQ